MSETYIINTDRNITNDEFHILLKHVNNFKKDEILRFYHYEDAQRALLGNILARYVISEKSGIINSELQFGTNDYGKPILLNDNTLHFNISHSGNWIVCAIDFEPIGIDVEMIKPIDYSIAERFYSVHEFNELISQSDELRLRYFFKLWTLKESYVKMIGKGLSVPLDSFSINICGNKINIENNLVDCYFSQYFLKNEAICSICTLNNNSPLVIRYDITNFLKNVYSSFQ